MANKKYFELQTEFGVVEFTDKTVEWLNKNEPAKRISQKLLYYPKIKFYNFVVTYGVNSHDFSVTITLRANDMRISHEETIPLVDLEEHFGKVIKYRETHQRYDEEFWNMYWVIETTGIVERCMVKLTSKALMQGFVISQEDYRRSRDFNYQDVFEELEIGSPMVANNFAVLVTSENELLDSMFCDLLPDRLLYHGNTPAVNVYALSLVDKVYAPIGTIKKNMDSKVPTFKLACATPVVDIESGIDGLLKRLETKDSVTKIIAEINKYNAMDKETTTVSDILRKRAKNASSIISEHKKMEADIKLKELGIQRKPIRENNKKIAASFAANLLGGK